MSKKLKGLLLALVLCLQVVVPATKAEAATVLYNNATGTEGAYNYELWKDYGDTSMTLNGNGLFECWWENIGNALFRKGVKWDCTKTYSQLGNITVNYGVNYQPNGNSYLCVYGWCRNPLVEYYIVDSWGTWRPPGANSKGTITVDGGTYDVYETTRVNQPSIDGNTTFQQYWSVRQNKRTSGTISVTEHFKAWERMGMKMGLMYEAALTVEGYQSSGWADVYQLDIAVGGSGSSSSGSSSSGDSSSSAPGTNQGTVIECESMTKSGQYIGNISNPFNGVALYGNDDAVSTTVNFTSGTHDFSLRGASNGDELAEVDLYIGGQKKGTFYYGDSNTAEYTIKNVSTGTGNQKVELRMTADTGSWDLYADALIIGGSGVNAGGSSSGGNTSGGNASGGNTSGGTTNTGATMECENMTKSGQYTGNISSPFNGVALYANDDAVSYTQNFTGGTSTFTLRGASNGDNMAQVDLYVGGQKKGTFYYGDANVADYVIENVSTGTGNQKVELKVSADDGQWDAYLDKLTISGGATSGGTTSGGNTSGGNTSGGNTSGGNTSGGNTSGGTTSGGNTSGGNTSGGNTSGGTTNTGATMECENMTKSGQYTGNISSPFNGVALYGNDDAVSYTQNFTGGTSTFTLRGASNGDNMAQVDLYVGGQKKGTFYYGDANVADYVIENVSTGTGNQKVELKVSADDGQWDAYLDKLTISGGATSGGTTGGGATGGGTTSGGNTSGDNTSGGNTGSNTSDTMQCENMTKSGQYTGNISSPFNGVALYGNDDAVSYTQYFANGTHDFTLRGASNGDNMARVDLVIGNEKKGTFYFGDANIAEYTISNVSHGTGDQTVKLVVTADDGQWDAYLDSLTISAAGSAGSGNSGSSGTTGGNGTVAAPSAAIPDPFVMNNGKVVSGLEDWKVRAGEIRDAYEENMYGVWRDGSDEQVTYSYNNGSLTIHVRRLSTGKTTSFKATVSLPNGSSWNPAGGYPVIVGMHEGISEKTATSNGYAVITIDGNSYPVASDDTNHKGAFYDLYPYGSSASEQTGVLMAWAWGASKVLDALEAGAGDLLNINEENSIVTGVSRWGKAASVCGAFEPRFKMVAPSCSGAGGLAMFRYTSQGKTYDFSSKGASSSYTYGQNEPLGSLQSTSERGWFNDKFLTYGNVNQLPFDQHYLASLVADSDRYLFIIGSCISEDWVNAPAMWFTYLATKEVYDYLGISDNIKINIHKEGHAVIEEDVKYMIQYFNQKVYGIQPNNDLSVLDTSVFALPQNWDPTWDNFNAGWSVK